MSNFISKRKITSTERMNKVIGEAQSSLNSILIESSNIDLLENQGRAMSTAAACTWEQGC